MYRKLLVLILCFVLTTGYANSFNKIVVFGDSVSDIGNLYRYSFHSLPMSPPYYKGRFSNGPIWVEYLAVLMHSKLENYSIGGSSTSLHTGMKGLPYSLKAQINSYSTKYIVRRSNERTLYVIWVGANDYLNAPVDIEKTVRNTIYALAYNIQWLVKAHGAKYFLIPNLPDLGLTPYAFREMSKKQLENLSKLSLEHNKRLVFILEILRKRFPKCRFVLLNANALFAKVRNDSKLISDRACYTGRYDLTHVLAEINRNFRSFRLSRLKYLIKPEAKVEKEIYDKRCENYVFWDHVHPTTWMHHLLAKESLELLEKVKN